MNTNNQALCFVFIQMFTIVDYKQPHSYTSQIIEDRDNEEINLLGNNEVYDEEETKFLETINSILGLYSIDKDLYQK